MLETLMNDIITAIQETKLFRQIEPYEGQFDNLDEFLVMPPSCFIELSGGAPDNALQRKSIIEVALYITTNHIKGKTNAAMLNALEMTKKALNQKRLTNGYTHYLSFDRLGIFPGFCTYRMMFNFKEDL
ncbi:MAG: hypothetical protein WDA18_09280 [Candidatus Ratteibacteria bacterium]|jgi:hypothetical protein|nr:hypothetical protein [Candidatus Cloacimonadota bacterium]HOQ79954.1 hypothetical protein [Candidatus Cloacimonadota bacterium]HPK40002.1 hypothetical protein [Candidatus Cloacimonadota bacterium]